MSFSPGKLLAASGSSVADQALQAGTSLTVSVLIGREIGLSALGTYALMYVVVVTVRALQESFLLQPLAVLSPRAVPSVRMPYERFVFAATLRLAGAWAICGLAAFVIVRVTDALSTGDALALAAMFIYSAVQVVSAWARRVHYVDGFPARAFAQSVCSFVVTAGCIALLIRHSQFTVQTAISALIAGAVSALLVFGFRHAKDRRMSVALTDDWRSMARRHWHLGKWTILGIPCVLLTFQGYFLIVSASIGVTATGLLKAMETLVAPFEQLLIALGMYFLPEAARSIDSATLVVQRRLLRRCALLFVAFALVYGAVAWVGRGLLFDTLLRLDAPLLDSVMSWLPLMLAVPVLKAIAYAAAIFLIARLRTDLTFLAYLAAAGVTIIVGIPSTRLGGMTGALLGVIASTLTFAVVLWLGAMRTSRDPRRVAVHAGEATSGPDTGS